MLKGVKLQELRREKSDKVFCPESTRLLHPGFLGQRRRGVLEFAKDCPQNRGCSRPEGGRAAVKRSTRPWPGMFKGSLGQGLEPWKGGQVGCGLNEAMQLASTALEVSTGTWAVALQA